MMDVLDSHTPVKISFGSDVFQQLCGQWADLSPSQNAEPSITVRDLMERESIDRARHAFEAGRRQIQPPPISTRPSATGAFGLVQMMPHDPADLITAITSPPPVDYSAAARYMESRIGLPPGNMFRVHEPAFEYTVRRPSFTPTAPQPVMHEEPRTEPIPAVALSYHEDRGWSDLPQDDIVNLRVTSMLQAYEEADAEIKAKPKKRRTHRVWQAILRFDLKDFINECLMSLHSDHYWE